MQPILGIPPGVDVSQLMSELMSYGALILPVIASVGAFWLIVKIFKRA